MILLDGKIAAASIEKKLKTKINKLPILPTFCVIQVGNNLSSNKYIKNKMLKAQSLGIVAKHIKTPYDIRQKKLIEMIKEESKYCNGLIVQLPLPEHLSKETILNSIPFHKDIDGLSKVNYMHLYKSNLDYIVPATARGILELVKYYKIKIRNQHVAVIGESNLVGKPTKKLFQQQGAHVTSFNFNTGIQGSENADILIVAAGSPLLVKKQNVKQGAIVIDVGINSIDINKENYTIGDVDFEDVKDKVKAISPVPGGVGPMTIISLFANLVEVIEKYQLVIKE